MHDTNAVTNLDQTVPIPSFVAIYTGEHGWELGQLLGRTTDLRTNVQTYSVRTLDEDLRHVQQGDIDGIYPYVGLYVVERRFGGSEEGGWYYDWAEHVLSFTVESLSALASADDFPQMFSIRQSMCKMLQDELGIGTYELSSVLSDGEVHSMFERFPGSERSTERPHYE